MHPNSLVDADSSFAFPAVVVLLPVAPVPAEADFEMIVIAPSDFAVVAAATDDSVASAAGNCCDLLHPSFLADENIGLLDSQILVATSLVVAAATPFGFALSALHIGFALGYSNLSCNAVAALHPSPVAAEHEEKLRRAIKEKKIWFS